MANLQWWKSFLQFIFPFSSPLHCVSAVLKYHSELRFLYHLRDQVKAEHNKTLEFEPPIMELRRWEEMQGDCLVSVFSKLGLDDLTTAVPFVCKSWNQASVDPLCRRILEFRHLDFDPSSPFATRFAFELSVPRFSFSGFLKLSLGRARGAAVDLRFNSQFNASKQDLILASDECPKLKNLILPRIGSEDEEEFLKAISKWKELEVLEMESKPSVLPGMVKQICLSCNKFQGLKLGGGSIKKEDAAAIVGSLPNLKWLDLSCCRMGREVMLSLVDGCRDLKRLSVRECIGFEVDEEVKRRASGIALFEHEGSKIEDECELEVEDDPNVSFEQMLMYYDDCYAMWLF